MGYNRVVFDDTIRKEKRNVKKIIVLGAGMVGGIIAKDLADDAGFDVSIADINIQALEKIAHSTKVRTIEADLSNPSYVEQLVSGYDMVCGALPSRFGLSALEAVIAAGRPYCDISFIPEDMFSLDLMAREQGVTVVVDCGVAPGMSNMLVGYAESQLDETIDVKIYVGGVPREPKPPWYYKAAFSPSDVIEEYTRISDIVRNGKIILVDALSETEMIEFPEIGKLEAFITDGLRSLVTNIDCPNMIEKTLRYPGHIDLIRVFRDAGFFSKEEVDLRNARFRPLDLAEKLIFPYWTYDDGEEDLTVMRIIVEGIKDGKSRKYTWDLLDYYDQQTKWTSMSRTTAFPCAIVARMIANGEYVNPGVNPPEYLGRTDGVCAKVLEELEKRRIIYKSKVE